MSNRIYIILGVLFAVYLGVSMMNRKRSKERKSRKFMENYKRKDKKEEQEGPKK